MLRRKLWIVSILLIMAMIAPIYGQQPDELDAEAMETFFAQELNRIIREQFNSPALARSETLDIVAQRIAENIGCREDTVRFDIPGDAVAQGYTPYPGYGVGRTTRVPLVPVVNNRPLDSLMRNYANVIFNSNINQAGLHYREIGVGISLCQNTRTPQYSLFVVLGAQPDIIPVVIENGTPTLQVESVPVTVNLSIHEENSRRAPGIFGKAASVRLSTQPLDERITAQDYAEQIPFELTECGVNTVYYELTDTEGVVVTGETSVELICGDDSEAEATPEATAESDS